MRMTNCDEIAAVLEHRAGRDDLIIVTSFLYGVSFQRYYHGQTPWLAVPQIEDFTLYRWDLLKQAMARPDPVPDLISRAEIVLRAGHKIFLVGKLGPPLQPSLNLFHPRPRAHSAGKWNLTSRSGSRSSLIGSNITHFTDAICQLKRDRVSIGSKVWACSRLPAGGSPRPPP